MAKILASTRNLPPMRGSSLPLARRTQPPFLPQERYNADWVEEQQVGLVVPTFRAIVEAVERLIEPATLTRYRANAAAIQNRAVFEIPEILDRVMAAAAPATCGADSGG